MSASFYDLLKYAKTGIASPSMTHYDKMKALSMCKAGFPVKTLAGVPPITVQSDGTPLTAWSISGNMVQTGTPSPTNIVIPQEVGNIVESGEHAGEYAVPITIAGQTQTVYLSEPLRKIGDYSDTVSSDGTATRRIKKKVLTGSELWQPLWDSMEIILDDAFGKTGTITIMSSHYAGKKHSRIRSRQTDCIRQQLHFLESVITGTNANI